MVPTVASTTKLQRRIQQREIAERAGVSISTVSRVLNNVPGISEELQQRVLVAARELGYNTRLTKAQSSARHLILLTNIASLGASRESFYADIVAGVEAECRRNEIQLSYSVFDPGAGRAFIIDTLKQTQSEGVLLLGMDDTALVEQVLALGIPAVLVNADHPDLAIDTFLPDNYWAAQRAVRRLIALGHRRILHVTFSDRPTIQRRLMAYRTVLEQAGVAFDPALVLHTLGDAAGAYEALKAYLASQVLDFTAVFCANDGCAIGVMSALQERGCRIPEHVSIIGYDDIPMASLLSPSLTSVRIEREELGTLAVRRLTERITEPTLTPIRVELSCLFIERQSIAAVHT